MAVHTFFLHLMLILLTARIFAELAVRWRAPSVIGELVAGVVLGPSLFGWIEPSEAIHLLAEIGIILLLFEVGLETDVTRLARAGRRAMTVAVAGFVFPFLLGFAAARYLFGLEMLIALFIGGTLTATSIGITVRVLSDLRRNNCLEGQIVLGAAVVDDVLGVILLAVLYEFSVGGGVSLTNVSKVMLFVGMFFLIAPVVAKLMAQWIKKLERASELPGLIPTTVVSLVLFFAWLAHAVGAPELLGGFAAGLALSRRFYLPFGAAIHADPPFAGHIHDQMRPIVYLFTPIFFVMVGLSLDLKAIDWGSPFIWTFSLVMLFVAVIGKLIGAVMLPGEPWPARLAIGMSMVPRGEVGLIFAELGRVSGVFDPALYAGLIIVIAVTTLAAPFAIKSLYGRYSACLLN